MERRRVDVSRTGALEEHLDGAEALHHCVNPSTYSAAAWRAELPAAQQAVLQAAGRAGLVVVFVENLYPYGPVEGPITETLPRTATRGKLGVRADLLRARAASDTANVSVAASDFFGPRVRNAHAGERLVPALLAGRRVSLVGSLDQPHSVTYVPDLARAMITASRTPALWGQVLHAPTGPAITQRQLAEALAKAAGAPSPRLGVLPAWVLRVAGVASSAARELAETSYQFTAPYVLDSSHSEELLGLSPTPLEVAAKETVAWWRSQPNA